LNSLRRRLENSFQAVSEHQAMTININILVFCFIASALVALLTTPLAKLLAIRAGALARPGGRHIHEASIPSWGGLAIACGFLLAGPVAAALFDLPRLHPRQLIGLLTGAGLIIAMGVVDDRFHIPARYKLIGQIIAAAILPFFGISITMISNPFGPEAIFPSTWLDWGLTIAWVVAATNAINLIDGLDGLAAGVSAISCLALATIGLMRGQAEVALLAVVLGGAAIGFLPWNFHPAKIFMGDTGAYFLGFIIGGITVLGAFKIAASIAIFIPILVLAIPLLEASLSISRRYLRGQPIFTADREHLHHRMLDMGMSQRQIALFMYCVTAFCCVIAIWISRPR
jgi:UDP-GlcNAc:undecaprenyl-phosphate GlcNAc-1-phosphate transferase